MRPPAVLLLDAMGTLLTLEAPAPRLRAELRRRLGAEVSPEAAEHAIAAEIAYYRIHLDEASDRLALARLHRACAEVIREALRDHPAVARADGGELTAALLASLRFRVFEDVLAALRESRRRGVRCVVVSNWDVSLHDVLHRVGLAEHLDGILTSAETGARKPAREIFLRALELARAAPEQARHVGDSLEEDVAGARAAGIEPVLLLRGGGPRPPGVRTIATLRELW
jgi:putative hydrolase of the HAD superfamily